jgi:asparagine synthase (glutamine-hydrolysing)
MCGFNLILKNPLVNNFDYYSVINNMNNEMYYRGPDSSKIVDLDKLILGHRRLSIIGLSQGDQPIFNEDESLILVCNGEIYNFIELKKKLEELGHIFSTASDNEVIIHLYEEYGERMFEYIQGMFAFALWDIKHERLIIARDKLGKKPIYFAKTNLGLVVSSEMKTIQKYVLQNASLNKNYIKSVLEFSYPTSMEDTLFNEIEKVKPGHFFKIENEKIESICYFSLTSKISDYSNIDVFERTHELLSNAVKLRLCAEVPVGIMLSGGIDSSAVASLARKHSNEIHAISVGYEGGYHVDERKTAERFAKDKGLIWHQIELSQKDFTHYFDEYVEVIDEPIADVSAFAQWGIYKKTAEMGFKVLLNGVAADEFFYGYQSHNQIGNYHNNFQKLGRYFPLKNKNLYLFLLRYLVKMNKNLKEITIQDFKNDFVTFKNFNSIDYDCFFEGVENIEKEIKYAFSNDSLGIDKIYYFLQTSWLTNNCFHLSDKLAMGNSIEVRSPFADSKLIEFVQQIPFEQKYHSNNPKWFLKEVLKNELPDYILSPPKKGFTPPYNFINDLVNNAPSSKFFNKKIVHFNELVVEKILSKYL